jgi:hypothetical protein
MQNVGKDALLSQLKKKPAASSFGGRCTGSKSATGLVC